MSVSTCDSILEKILLGVGYFTLEASQAACPKRSVQNQQLTYILAANDSKLKRR